MPNWLAIDLCYAGNRESFIWLRSDKNKDVSVDAVGIGIAVLARRLGTGIVGPGTGVSIRLGTAVVVGRF